MVGTHISEYIAFPLKWAHTHIQNRVPPINRGCMHKRSANKIYRLRETFFFAFYFFSAMFFSSFAFFFFALLPLVERCKWHVISRDSWQSISALCSAGVWMLFIEFLNICQSWFGYFCLKPMSIGPILIFVWMNTSTHACGWGQLSLFRLIFFYFGCCCCKWPLCVLPIQYSINRKGVRTQVNSIGNKIEWIRLYRL